MKKLLGFLIALFVIVPLSAATDLKVQWIQNAPAEGVTGYNLYIDNLAPVLVANILNTTCTCVQSLVTFVTGAHTVSVRALAPSLSTDPTSSVEGDPATVTFTLNPGSQVKGIKVVK